MIRKIKKITDIGGLIAMTLFVISLIANNTTASFILLFIYIILTNTSLHLETKMQTPLRGDLLKLIGDLNGKH